MRKDSIELVDTRTSAVEIACSHRISRFLSASEERVRNVLLDPELRAMWAKSSKLSTIVSSTICEPDDVLIHEFVEHHAVDIRIRILERPRVCEVHVELRMGPAEDRSNLIDGGIDDLWETRLYAIADLLALTTPRHAERPPARLDQQLRTLEAQ